MTLTGITNGGDGNEAIVRITATSSNSMVVSNPVVSYTSPVDFHVARLILVCMFSQSFPKNADSKLIDVHSSFLLQARTAQLQMSIVTPGSSTISIYVEDAGY